MDYKRNFRKNPIRRSKKIDRRKLSREERLARLKSNLAKQAGSSVDEVDHQMALAVVILEKELNVGPIGEDYPLMKFFMELEMLKEIKEKENSAYKGNNLRPNTFG